MPAERGQRHPPGGGVAEWEHFAQKGVGRDLAAFEPVGGQQAPASATTHITTVTNSRRSPETHQPASG